VAHKAFVVLEQCASRDDIPGLGGQVSGHYALVDEDGNAVSSPTGCSAQFGYSDSAQTVHEKIADMIRESNEDPTIVVIFFDSPGRY